jgi:hypothetical protein
LEVKPWFGLRGSRSLRQRDGCLNFTRVILSRRTFLCVAFKVPGADSLHAHVHIHTRQPSGFLGVSAYRPSVFCSKANGMVHHVPHVCCIFAVGAPRVLHFRSWCVDPLLRPPRGKHSPSHTLLLDACERERQMEQKGARGTWKEPAGTPLQRCPSIAFPPSEAGPSPPGEEKAGKQEAKSRERRCSGSGSSHWLIFPAAVVLIFSLWPAAGKVAGMVKGAQGRARARGRSKSKAPS